MNINHIFLCFLLVVFVAAAAYAAEIGIVRQPDGSVILHIPAELIDACNREGGCQIFSQQYLQNLISEARKSSCI